MTSLPWFPFFPRDWRSDPWLRACSLSARGLWTDLLALAHEGEPRGHVLIHGEVPTLEELARMVGAPVSEVEAGLVELKRGVARFGDRGEVVSGRMERDESYRQVKAESGRRGGVAKSKQSSSKALARGLANAKQSSSETLATGLAPSASVSVSISSEEEGGLGETLGSEARALERARHCAPPTTEQQYPHVAQCPLCPQPLRLRHGKHGPWYAHPLGAGDPTHKWSADELPVVEAAQVKRGRCPLCRGDSGTDRDTVCDECAVVKR